MVVPTPPAFAATQPATSFAWGWSLATTASGFPV